MSGITKNAPKSGLSYYFISITFIASIFFIIPFELYFNARDYWNWNKTIPIYFALAGGLFCLLQIAALQISSKINLKLFRTISLCFFLIGVFIVMADIFAPLQTTLLDGNELASKEPFKYTLFETLMGIILIICVIVFDRRLLTNCHLHHLIADVDLSSLFCSDSDCF